MSETVRTRFVDNLEAALKIVREYEDELDAKGARIRELEKALEPKPMWETIATAMDRYRVIPRAILASYGILIWHSVNWVLAQPDPGYAVAGMVSVLTAAAAPMVGSYLSTGK